MQESRAEIPLVSSVLSGLVVDALDELKAQSVKCMDRTITPPSSNAPSYFLFKVDGSWQLDARCLEPC